MAPPIKLTDDEVKRRFSYHAPDANRRAAHETIRAHFIGLAQTLILAVPEGRELSLCMTALEEAMFWANAGVARPAAE